MMKKTIILIGLLIWMIPVESQNQQQISLKECLDKAIEIYPGRKQLVNNQKELELNMQNLNNNYLPSLNLNGQASYQSDVTHIPNIPNLGITLPSMSKDWYKVNLNLEQLIWDGGATKAQKKLAESNYKIADQQVQVSIYQLKNRIAVYYFQVLFLKENLQALYVMRDDLKARIKDAETAVKNGALLISDLQTLQVSEKQADQLIIQKEADIKSMLASMSELTGLKINSEKQLEMPDLSISAFPFNNLRPEYKLLEEQQNKLQAMNDLTSVKRRPIFKLFGQAGYGRPGLNMLDNNFSDYYVGGIQFYWKILDWNKTKREKQILTIQNNNLEASKETFNQNLRAEYSQQLLQIEKFKKLVQSDKEIVALQNNVMKTALNKFKNGTLTTTDYLIELNKKVKAELNLQAHKTQLLFSKYQYLIIMGSI
ncbi:MAG: TolC family protein [Bacteroidales bacterium]|nr:TolC family protein [Bacteroidales bacterium]